jgi:glycopeptide antibiotics resistance protein
MQTLSNMRRNSAHNRYLKLFFLALLFITYQIFAGIYAFLPPLIGFLFAYIVKNFAKDTIEMRLSFLYLCFFELNQGFYLFSMVFFFIIFYYLLRPKIISIFEGDLWITSITIVSAYWGLYIVNFFFSYFLNRPFPSFSSVYIFYPLMDIALAYLFLKKKI